MERGNHLGNSRARNRLNPAFVAGVRPADHTRRHGDGNGLFLVVRPTGAKSWMQRLTVDGRPRDIGLGSLRDVSLKEARAIALENRRVARRGGDPTRRRPGMPTFAEAFDAVVALRRPTWKDPDAMETRWRRSMERHAMVRLGRMPVGAVATADVLAVLQPVWATLHEAPRLRQRIGLAMQWAVAQGHRTDNPAGEALAAALPRTKRAATPRRALHHSEVAAALATVRSSDAPLPVRLAFEAMVLCAVRSGEARGATLEEVDLGSATWTVPAARAKTARPHRVPLSDRAVEVFREAGSAGHGELLFPSRRAGAPIHRRTFARLMPRLGIDAHPHGFRSSFRDWAAETTDAPREVMEAALGHVTGSATEAAYARTDLLERRRPLMQRWSDYLTEDGS